MKSLGKDMPTLKWIFRVAGSDRKWIFIVVLLQVLQGLEGTLSTLALRSVLGTVLQNNRNNFLLALLVLLALTLISIELQTLVSYTGEKGIALLEQCFRKQVFRELMRRSYTHILARHSGEWLARVCSDARIVPESLMQSIPRLLGLVIQIASALWALFFLLPEASYLIIPGGMLLILVSVLFRTKLKFHYGQVWATDAVTRAFMQEQLSNLTIVRAFTQEENAVEQSGRQMDKWTQARLRCNRWVTFYRFVVNSAARCGYFICIIVCGLQLRRGKIGYETLVAVLMLVRQAGLPMADLSNLAPKYFAMLSSAERMMEIETYPLDRMGEPYGKEFIRSYYAQRFFALGIHHGSFIYDGDEKQTVLSDFELEVHKNQFVAFLGSSGCGKSTVLKLLLSLYPLQEGEAYLRDNNGNEHILDVMWRGLFAYVPQGNQLLNGTIREAVTFGVQDLMEREQDIWDALRIACADDFVSELPDGLDNGLGERGTGLSEGQMQRIAIARAVFSERPILLLDEATSALDSETERQLLCNLRTLADRTVILVTHRPAAVEICDVKIEFPPQ